MKNSKIHSKNSNLDYAKKMLARINNDLPYVKGKLSVLLELCKFDIFEDDDQNRLYYIYEDSKGETHVDYYINPDDVQTNEMFETRLNKIIKSLEKIAKALVDV